MKIRLNPKIKVRKEQFGCIVLDLPNKEINFYNAGAYEAFKMLSNPLPYDDFIAKYHKNDKEYVNKFIQSMEIVGKLEVAAHFEVKKEMPEFFFENEAEFFSTHFVSPLAVEIEPTLKCSRNCSYCCYESNPFINTSKELNVEDWKKILYNLKENGVFSIKFTGGDPLMKKGFFEILKEADNLGFLLTVGSDLTLLQDAHIDIFSELQNLVMVQTTLDGSIPAISDFHRGKGNYEKVISGIQKLHHRKIPFSVVTVITSHNYHDIYNIGLLLKEFSPLGFDIGMLFDSGRAKEMPKEAFPSEQQIKQASSDYSKLITDGIVNSINKAFTYNLEKRGDVGMIDYFLEQNKIQKSPESQLRIDPQGRCYVSITLKEKLQDDLFLGNLSEDSIKDIWNQNLTLKKLRNLSNEENHFGKYFYLNNLI